MATTSNLVAKLLPKPPKLAQLSVTYLRIVTAMRVTVMGQAQDFDVKPYLIRQFHCEKIAEDFAEIVTVMQRAWPEPVMVHRPCRNHMSYDEVWMVDLVQAVAQGDRRAFDDLIRDMVGHRDRSQLFNAIHAFSVSASNMHLLE